MARSPYPSGCALTRRPLPSCQVRLQSVHRGSTARTVTSRQLQALVMVQANWRGFAGRRGAARRRRLVELYATEDATGSEAAGTTEALRQRSTLSRGARTALRDAEVEAAAGAVGAVAALLTSRLLAENLRFALALHHLGCGPDSGHPPLTTPSPSLTLAFALGMPAASPYLPSPSTGWAMSYVARGLHASLRGRRRRRHQTSPPPTPPPPPAPCTTCRRPPRRTPLHRTPPPRPSSQPRPPVSAPTARVWHRPSDNSVCQRRRRRPKKIPR